MNQLNSIFGIENDRTSEVDDLQCGYCESFDIRETLVNVEKK